MHSLVVEQCLAIDPGDDQARYFYAVLDRRENKLEDAERRIEILGERGDLKPAPASLAAGDEPERG